MKKRIKNEDVTMLIIFGVCIGVQLGMFILAGLRALETSGIL